MELIHMSTTASAVVLDGARSLKFHRDEFSIVKWNLTSYFESTDVWRIHYSERMTYEDVCYRRYLPLSPSHPVLKYVNHKPVLIFGSHAETERL
jgi:hypothetical protein